MQNYVSAYSFNNKAPFRAQTCDCLQEPSCPEPDNRPLLTKSEEFLLALLKGKNTTDPDVMLKLEDDLLPGHRFLLSASSEYFRAMFKASMPNPEN